MVSDIPGAFLHADMEDNVNMLLEGTIAENWTKHYTENINGTTNMENLCYM